MDELALVRLENLELRKYLTRELTNSPLFKDQRKTEVRVTLEQIAGLVRDGRSEYLAVLVRQANVLCERGDFVRSLTGYLLEFVNGSQGEKCLKAILQQLLTAIEIRGSRSRASCRNLFNEIFQSKGFVEDGHYYNRYPSEAFDQQDAEELENVSGTAAYEEVLKQKCENLSIEERFSGLARAVLSVDRSSSTYIFPVAGMKGTASLAVGDVEFYAPATNPKLVSDGGLNPELFGRQESDALNAAVTVSGATFEASQKALKAAETAVDLISYYASGYEHIQLRSGRMLIVDESGRWRGSSSSGAGLHDDLIHKYRALETDNFLGTITFPIIRDAADGIRRLRQKPRPTQRLVTSLRAFKKAEGSSIAEDRLVSYWIAIESLFARDRRTGYFKQEASSENAEQLALEVLPSLGVMSMLASVAVDLMGYLRNAIANEHIQEYKEALSGVPKKLRIESRVLIDEWTSYPLSEFIDRLSEWQKAVQVGSRVSERVDFAFKFYTDNAWAKRALETHKARARDQVVVIYQLRNRIVHNAFFDPPGLDYFISKARHHANLMIRCVLAHPRLEAFEALTEQHASAERLLLMLRDPEHVNLNRYGPISKSQT